MNSSHWLFARCRGHNQSIAVWAILFVHALLLARIAYINAPVFDEIAHLPAGLSHWKFGNFDLYRVNPPLMRMIASTPLLLINPQTDWSSISDGPYARPEFVVGSKFMRANGYESFWLFSICRWAQIPVSMFGGWICFRWARELFGPSSGFVALLLWSTCPNVLAWGSTITPDNGAAAFGVAAAYAFWRWLKTPSWSAALIAGIAMGLAELSKSTWIILFLLWPVLWFAWRCCIRTVVVPKPRVLQLVCLCLLGLYVLNLGYGLDGSFQRLGQFTFISQSLGGPDAHTAPGNRFRDSWIGSIPVPVPANYLRGIDIQKFDFEKGKWSYLRGEQKLGGWWYYYLYALAVKTPLGTLFLMGLTILLLAISRGYSVKFRDEIVLLIPALTVLAVVSSQTGFNRYLRYVLPALPFLFIFASQSAKAFELKQRLPRLLCVISTMMAILGSLLVFPHSMSYFNLVAGGPLGGPRHLLDANIDWGQDLLELKRFVDAHPEATPINLIYFGFADQKLAGFRAEPQSTLDNTVTRPNLTPGWYAISVNHLYGYRHYENDQPTWTRFQHIAPDMMAGYSIYLYHMTAERLDRLNQQ
ncbi:ArnT family glycosyltransferase [Schlesneria paludicola]|uniref:ArnT family glycosyltransferase n=1 Tax=Schlesneria paludicola TaxID=360056 RepID=UPI000299F855|nr:glycosyltransferase family 39 protein [Schlesneria paludicola]